MSRPATSTAAASRALGPAGAVVPGPLDMQAALTGPLEIARLSPETEALRIAAAPLVFSVLLLVVIAVFVRVAVGQSSRRSLAPAVAVIVAALVLAGGWMMADGFRGHETEAAD